MPIIIGPFDNVPAPGDPIRSAWPQEISQHTVNTAQAVNDNWAKGRAAVVAATKVPTGNIDASASGFTDWLGGVTLAVPAGISRAMITTTVSGHQIVTADAIFEMCIHFGNLPAGRTVTYSGSPTSGRALHTWMSEFVNPPGGVTSIAVMARRAFSSGVLRADTFAWAQFTAFFVYAA